MYTTCLIYLLHMHVYIIIYIYVLINYVYNVSMCLLNVLSLCVSGLHFQGHVCIVRYFRDRISISICFAIFDVSNTFFVVIQYFEYKPIPASSKS